MEVKNVNLSYRDGDGQKTLDAKRGVQSMSRKVAVEA